MVFLWFFPSRPETLQKPTPPPGPSPRWSCTPGRSPGPCPPLPALRDRSPGGFRHGQWGVSSAKAMGKPWENIGKPWENHRKTMGKHKKTTIGKPWKTYGKWWFQVSVGFFRCWFMMAFSGHITPITHELVYGRYDLRFAFESDWKILKVPQNMGWAKCFFFILGTWTWW